MELLRVTLCPSVDSSNQTRVDRFLVIFFEMHFSHQSSDSEYLVVVIM